MEKYIYRGVLVEDQEKTDQAVRRRTLDLSLVQVAASALAAVVAAVLASELGVYGTFAGAAVVSVAATTGGAVFQHLFHRTGEELRSRAPTVAGAAQTPEEEQALRRAEARDAFGGAVATGAFDPFDPGGEHTRLLAEISPPSGAESVTTYRGSSARRPRTWRTYALAAGLVFALSMSAIAVTELVAGKPWTAIVRNESGSGTSFGGSVGPSAPARKQSSESGNPGAAATPTPTPAGSGSPSAGAGPTPTVPPSATPSSTPGATAGSTPGATPGSSASAAASAAPGAGGSATPTP
jgi:hypothetical protein